MLGEVLVTKQTGAAGKPVNCVYVARKMKLKNEKYFAILLDRKTQGPMVIACSEVRGHVGSPLALLSGQTQESLLLAALSRAGPPSRTWQRSTRTRSSVSPSTTSRG